MENFKKLFLDFMARDKSIFLFTSIKTLVLVLYFVSMFFGFITGDMIINGRVQLIKFPGMWWLSIIFIVFMLLSLYFTVLNNTKNAKLFFALDVVLATLFFVWGNIVYQVGIPTAKVGYGFILNFIMLSLAWFLLLKQELALKLVKKYLIIQQPDPTHDDATI